MKRNVFARVAAAVGATALAFGLTMAQPASAQAVELNMDVDVSTTIGAIGQTVDIPTGTLTGNADLGAGEMSGSMDLPATSFDYTAFGLLPVTVTFEVDEVEPGVTGTIDLDTMTIEEQVHFNIRLTSVSALGFLELLDANQTCVTSEPSVADLSGTMNLDDGISAELSGDFEIAPLEGCGLFGAVISGMTAGPDNTLEVTAVQR